MFAGNSKFLSFKPGSHAIAYKFMQLCDITKPRTRFLKPRARSCVNSTPLHLIRTQQRQNTTQYRVLKLKNHPRARSSMRGPCTSVGFPPAAVYASISWDFLTHSQLSSAHNQHHPHAAEPKETHQRALQLSSHKNACSSMRAPRTSVGSSMLLYKSEQHFFFFFFFVSHIQFLIPDAVAIPSSQTHQKLICTKKKKILHTHLPNIHAFLTTIHLSLINFFTLNIAPNAKLTILNIPSPSLKCLHQPLFPNFHGRKGGRKLQGIWVRASSYRVLKLIRDIGELIGCILGKHNST